MLFPFLSFLLSVTTPTETRMKRRIQFLPSLLQYTKNGVEKQGKREKKLDTGKELWYNTVKSKDRGASHQK